MWKHLFIYVVHLSHKTGFKSEFLKAAGAGMHAFISDMIKDVYIKTNASLPFYVHIFVDNSLGREPVWEKVKRLTTAKLHLKRRHYKGGRDGGGRLCFFLSFKVPTGFIVETWLCVFNHSKIPFCMAFSDFSSGYEKDYQNKNCYIVL